MEAELHGGAAITTSTLNVCKKNEGNLLSQIDNQAYKYRLNI